MLTELIESCIMTWIQWNDYFENVLLKAPIGIII